MDVVLVKIRDAADVRKDGGRGGLAFALASP